MHERDGDAEAGEAKGGLDAEQAAADHDGARARPCAPADRRHVGEVAKGR